MVPTPSPAIGLSHAATAKRERSGVDAGFATYALAKMGRGEKVARGEPVGLEGLQQELDFLGAALQAADGSPDAETRAVFAELWEEADEALVAALGAVAAEEASDDPRLPVPGDLAVRPGAEAEAEEALRELLSQAAAPERWPIDEDIIFEFGSAPCSAPVRQPQEAPVPTPCRAAPGAPVGRGNDYAAPAAGPSASTSSSAAPGQSHGHGHNQSQSQAAPPRPAAGSSFRMASEMCPPIPKSNAAAGAANSSSSSSSTNFDDVSKSILQKKKDGGGNEQRSEKKDGKSGEGREWSEEWLRIADTDQLERIVPALEATIHKDSGGRDRITKRDIAGLSFVKNQIEEVLILPQLHPYLFNSALTRPARGLLLFGPPGTGKTLLARWIAAQCGATFFNVNASSVLSKWIGEAEKTVKALFQLAKERQPSVIFIDEIDSMLSARKDGDNESSRRVKNEFLTSLEGADTAGDDKVLLIGATNMPWELDPAALRRLPKRLYVPLPGKAARRTLLQTSLDKHNSGLGLQGAMCPDDMERVSNKTEGFSGSDMQALLREAAMGPVREATMRRRGVGANAGAATSESLRDIKISDFEVALKRVKPSHNQDQESKHRAFNEEHGTCRGDEAMKDAESDEEEAAELAE